MSYQILDIVRATDPERAARAFGTALALEKGYTSRIERVEDGWVCIASDDRAIKFKCDLCDGTMIVSRGTQAGSACHCDPNWSEHRTERESDIRNGLDGFTGPEDHITYD